jgi:phage shock protein PspC (stress-responsive transcriptional regulator)
MTEITETPIEQAPPRRLVRTADDRWLAGVCAGLGRYFDVSPLVYRIAFAALAFAGGTGILLYIAAVLVIPSETAEDSIAVEALRDHRDRPWLLAGVGLLGFGAVLALSEARFWPGPGNVWLAATIAGAALVWWHMGGREARRPAPPGAPPGTARPGEAPSGVAPPMAARVRAPRRPSLFFPVVGVLIAAAGVLGLLETLDAVETDWRVAFAGGTVLVGAAIAAGAVTGRRVGGLILVGLVMLGGFGIAVASPSSFSGGIGDRYERPAVAADLRHYELAVGDLTVDLGDTRLPPGETHLDVDLGFGDLTVFVPDDVAVRIDARAGFGHVDVLGRTDEGWDAKSRVDEPGVDSPSTLVLDAEIGAGDLEVSRR